MSNLKINMNNPHEVEIALNSRELRVCVVGIGRIGLPTALSFAKSGLQTIGIDINENLVQKINSGTFPLNDEPGYEEIFHDVIKNKKSLPGVANGLQALPEIDVGAHAKEARNEVW